MGRSRCGSAVATEAAVEAALERAGLNAGQSQAVRTLPLSPHRTVGVQGHAGSGKTRVLRTVAALAPDRPVVGLAPSAGAVRVLAAEADIPARTLQASSHATATSATASRRRRRWPQPAAA